MGTNNSSRDDDGEALRSGVANSCEQALNVKEKRIEKRADLPRARTAPKSVSAGGDNTVYRKRRARRWDGAGFLPSLGFAHRERKRKRGMGEGTVFHINQTGQMTGYRLTWSNRSVGFDFQNNGLVEDREECRDGGNRDSGWGGRVEQGWRRREDTSRRTGLCESPSWLQELATVSDFHRTCDRGGGWTEGAPEARVGDCMRGLTASLSATPIAGERPPPTTSQPPPPSSQRSPSTAPTQDLLADRAAQHCSTQPAPSAQQVGTTLASRTHHHPQSLATRKSHPASQDHPLTQDHPADTEHRIKSDMEPEPPSQIEEYVTDFYLPWSRYKGGPSLPRKLISQGATQKQYSVEVYPLILKLTDARDKSVSTVKLSKKVPIDFIWGCLVGFVVMLH
ncbi:Putative ubiquitin carboxyl-terminal hydrolase [Arachis hypogaea]|uniref:Ubiquitin carboxyl-terminal hydrolase n=1 Tax=Arachis hypogaea TaxID=3818 RepID=A0A6B9V6C9_ARAHY|nr:Putative ubiquitin carboxyl-terminal hydrolase [Arachis hypogaea]